MYRNILVSLDGSTFSEQALPTAISIAKRAGANLHLMQVFTPLSLVDNGNPLFFDAATTAHLRGRVKSYLNEVVDRIKAVTAVPVFSTLLEGEIAESIRTMASKTSADLIVMTTHGRGALGRLWLGSVADQLIRQSSTPILLHRPTETAADFGKDVEWKHILVPLDGTPLAEQVLDRVLDLGALMACDYTLLRAITPILPWGGAVACEDDISVAVVETINKIQGELRGDAQAYLNRIVDRLSAKDRKVTTRVVETQQPAEGVLEIAKRPAIDLVALSTHGRKGLSRFFLGSVADKVIRAAHVPVLVFKPTESG